jgi:hypothetical protein
MLVSIEPELLWQQLVELSEQYKIFSSLLFIVCFLICKKLLVKGARRQSKRKGEDRRHQINMFDQLANAGLIIVLLFIWSSEVQSLAISIAAFFVAIVLATREIIQCFVGFVYHLSARPFRVGDWVQLGTNVGEVVEIDWAKTTLLEVDAESFSYTGKHVYVPNSQLMTQMVKNLNFLRRYTLHNFTITNEPTVNPYIVLPEFIAKAQDHCAHFRDVAERYKALIERHLDVEFIQIDPEITMHTNQFAKHQIIVSLFCPTEQALSLEQKINADWMALWFEASQHALPFEAPIKPKQLKKALDNKE